MNLRLCSWLAVVACLGDPLIGFPPRPWVLCRLRHFIEDDVRFPQVQALGCFPSFVGLLCAIVEALSALPLPCFALRR